MNSAKLLFPFELLAGLLLSLLTALILVVATIMSISSATRYLKMKNM